MATHISNSPEATFQFGKELAANLVPGDVVGLTGDLGAGKTQLVKGIAAGLGISERVHSPTFTLVNQYTSGRIPCNHLDLYRLETAGQILDAGLEPYIFNSDAVALIEWFDRWTDSLPPVTQGWNIEITSLEETGRQIRYDRFSP